jgi:hypothetical protein
MDLQVPWLALPEVNGVEFIEWVNHEETGRAGFDDFVVGRTALKNNLTGEGTATSRLRVLA